MRKIMILFGFLLFMAFSVATAAPSLQGATGLINTPSADVLQQGQFTLGLDYNHGGSEQNVVMGVASRIEMGVIGINDPGVSNKILLNGKYSLLPEQILTPGISVGVEDAFNQNQRSDYAVVSKTLPFGFRIHAGVGNGFYHGTFAGIEKTINPVSFLTGSNTFPATTLIAEYDGNTMNYGIRLAIVPGLKVEGGVRSHAAYYGINFTM